MSLILHKLETSQELKTDVWPDPFEDNRGWENVVPEVRGLLLGHGCYIIHIQIEADEMERRQREHKRVRERCILHPPSHSTKLSTNTHTHLAFVFRSKMAHSFTTSIRRCRKKQCFHLSVPYWVALFIYFLFGRQTHSVAAGKERFGYV